MDSLKKLIKKTQKEIKKLLKASMSKQAMSALAGVKLDPDNIHSVLGEQSIKIKEMYRKILDKGSYYRFRITIGKQQLPPAEEGELRPGYSSIMRPVDQPDDLFNTVSYLAGRQKRKGLQKKFTGFCPKCNVNHTTDWREPNEEGIFRPLCPNNTRHGEMSRVSEETKVIYDVSDDDAVGSLFRWLRYPDPERGFINVPVAFARLDKRPIAFDTNTVLPALQAEMDRRSQTGQDPKLSYSDSARIATEHAYYTHGRLAFDGQNLPLPNPECPSRFDSPDERDRNKDFMLNTACSRDLIIPMLTPKESTKTREGAEGVSRYKKKKRLFDESGNEIIPETVDDIVKYGDAYFPLLDDYEVMPQKFQTNQRNAFPSTVSRGTSAKKGWEFEYNESVDPEYRLGADIPVATKFGSTLMKQMQEKYPDMVLVDDYIEPYLEEAKRIVRTYGSDPDADTGPKRVKNMATRLALDAEAEEAEAAGRPSMRQRINMFNDFVQSKIREQSPDDIRKSRSKMFEGVPFEERDASFTFSVDHYGDWKKTPSTHRYVFENDVPIPNKVIDVVITPEFVPYKDSKNHVRKRKYYYAGWSEVREASSMASSPITTVRSDFSPSDEQGQALFNDIDGTISKGRGYYATLDDAFVAVQKNFCVDISASFAERNSGIRPSNDEDVVFDPETNLFHLRKNFDASSLERAQAAFAAFSSMDKREFEQYRIDHPEVVQAFLPGLLEGEDLSDISSLPTHAPLNVPMTDSGDNRELVDTLGGVLDDLGIAPEDIEEVSTRQQNAAIRDAAQSLRESMEESVAVAGEGVSGDELIGDTLHNARVRQHGEERALEIEREMEESANEAEEILEQRRTTEDERQRKPFNAMPLDSVEEITEYAPDVSNEDAEEGDDEIGGDINVVTIVETERYELDNAIDEAESMEDVEEAVEEQEERLEPSEEIEEVTPEVVPEGEAEVVEAPAEEEIELDESGLPILPTQTPAAPEVGGQGTMEQDFQEVPQGPKEEDEEEVLDLPDFMKKEQGKSGVVEELVKLAEKYDREGKFEVSKKIDSAIEKIIGKKIKY